MGIESISEGKFISGNFNRDTYRAVVEYIVITNDKDDGPDTIRRDPQFRIGRGYSFGNDRNMACQLREVSPSLAQSEDSRIVWLVRCSFETPKPGEGSDPSGPNGPGGGDLPTSEDYPELPESDSTEESMEINFVTASELTNNAKYIGTFFIRDGVRSGGDNITSLGGKWTSYTGNVLNSALSPHVPSPENEVLYPVVRVTGNVGIRALNPLVPKLIKLGGAINRAPVSIWSPATVAGEQYKFAAKAYELKCVGVHVGKIERGNIRGTVGLSLEFAFNPKTWLLEILDEGYSIQADANGFNSRDASGVEPEQELIRDGRGGVLPTPTLLDGLGNVNRRKAYVYYNRWLPDADKTFDSASIPKLYEGM